MNIGTYEANPDPDPPCDPSYDGLNRNAISDGDKGDDEDEDGDSDAVDGSTVEAYVVLAKKACKYYFTGYCPIHILTYIYSAQSLPEDIADEIKQPEFPDLIRQFI
jgi:hypothetical protein